MAERKQSIAASRLSHPQRDALKLLERLAGPCGDGDPARADSDHDWRRCVRCSSLAKIQDHDPLMLRLLRVAVRSLRKADAMPDVVAPDRAVGVETPTTSLRIPLPSGGRTSESWQRFEAALAKVLSVSKQEIERRIATAKVERDQRRRPPGPKPGTKKA